MILSVVHSRPESFVSEPVEAYSEKAPEDGHKVVRAEPTQGVRAGLVWRIDGEAEEHRMLDRDSEPWFVGGQTNESSAP